MERTKRDSFIVLINASKFEISFFFLTNLSFFDKSNESNVVTMHIHCLRQQLMSIRNKKIIK